MQARVSGKFMLRFGLAGDEGSLVQTDSVSGTRERMEYNRRYLYGLLAANGWSVTEQHWGLRQKILVLSRASANVRGNNAEN